AGVGAALVGTLKNSVPFLGQFLPTLNPVVSGLVALAATSPQVRDAFAGLVHSLAPLIVQIGAGLNPILGVLSDALGELLPAVIAAAKALLEAIFPILGPTADAFKAIALPLVDALIPPLISLVPIVQAVAGVFVSFLQALGRDEVINVVTTALRGLVPVMAAI